MVAPYGPQLSFQQFREILEQRHECTFRWLVPLADVVDIDGTPAPGIGFFERIVNGKPVQHPVVVYFEQQKMTRTVLRSTCAALNIDVETFHLYLQ